MYKRQDQVVTVTHNMVYTPNNDEVQISLKNLSGTPANLEQFWIRAITATEVEAVVKFASGGNGAAQVNFSII